MGSMTDLGHPSLGGQPTENRSPPTDLSSFILLLRLVGMFWRVEERTKHHNATRIRNWE